MEMSIPVYVETVSRQGESRPRFRCAPLFAADSVRTENEVLSRAMAQLARRLKRHLDSLGREPRHDALSTAAYHPEFESHVWKFRLDLRDRTLQCTYLFVVVHGLHHTAAFTPRLPELWIDIAEDEDPRQRVHQSLEDYFRRLKTEDPAEFTRQAGSSLKGKAWLTTIEIDVAVRQPTRREEEKRWALLWDETKMDGEEELNRVGRCLDWQYPDDLQRAVGRSDEVGRLMQLLAEKERRGILLVGPRLSGKTTVLHECVWRRVKARKKRYATKQNVWLISPGRLISGMSYVGQWENRWIAILDRAAKRDHTLYFDDLLSMYRAGITRDSELCAADVLKPRVVKGEVRAVAEMTPEALHVFQERDRGFADQFQIIRVDETSEADTLRVLLEVSRHLEGQHRCRFQVDVLPAVTEVQRRYVPGAAFPGKAGRMLTRLAVKHAGQAVRRRHVLHEFHQQTGLQLALLDAATRLPRENILQGLAERMVGQEAAVEAAADTIAITKARLNAANRPLGVLLFLGPTGVGKTECAKAIARYLYSDADKLVRLDMNEFVTAADAARLVGTFDQPDGLLTGPVRRRPFSVVLLDEIEKAHLDVHNLLLQVTGEGRLTDALGRTADFSGTIIVLTSNLGTRTAAQSFGFTSADGQADKAAAAEHHFVKAAERFFSPELFNRFDRVVPFRQLTPAELECIAGHLLRDVFNRDGLVRRRSLLHIDPQARQHVIEKGRHPKFGARALKRSIEREVARPVGRQLAELTAQRPTMVRVFPAEGGVVSLVDELVEAEARPSVSAPDDYSLELAEMRRRAERIQQQTLQLKPAGGLNVGSLTPRDFRYLALREQFEAVQQGMERIESVLAAEREETHRPMIATAQARRSSKEIARMEHGSARQLLLDLHSTDDINAYVRQRFADAGEARTMLESSWADLHHEMSLLEAFMNAPAASDRGVLLLFPLGDCPERLEYNVCRLLARYAEQAFQLELRRVEMPERLIAFAFGGAFALTLMQCHAGLHIGVGPSEQLSGLHAVLLPLEDDETPEAVIARCLKRRAVWLSQLGSPGIRPAEPYPLGRVLRLYYPNGVTTDLARGLTLPFEPSAEALRQLFVGPADAVRRKSEAESTKEAP
jgi:ATP-dependent Clp protease ATP-binding subunit ClpC